MTNKEFILDLQKLCHFDSQQCTAMLNALCRLMAQAGVEQVPVTLCGLGTFVSHKHPEYIQEDPQTGCQTLYPPRISYRMQAEDKDATIDIVARQLADHCKASIDDATLFLDCFVRQVYAGLQHGEDVFVKGLGTFRNIISNQGDLQRVAYTPDEQMRSAVNAPFNCFESIIIDGYQSPVTVMHAQTGGEGTVAAAVGVAAVGTRAVGEEPEAPRMVAEETQTVAEEARTVAEEARTVAEEARTVAEEDRTEAEDQLTEAEAPVADVGPVAAETAATEEQVPSAPIATVVDEEEEEEEEDGDKPVVLPPAARTVSLDDLDDDEPTSRKSNKLLITACILISLVCILLGCFIYSIFTTDPLDDIYSSHDEPGNPAPQSVAPVADTMAGASSDTVLLAAADSTGLAALSADTKAETEDDAKSEAKTEAMAATTTEPKAAAKPDPKSESKDATKSDTKAATKPDTKAAAKPADTTKPVATSSKDKMCMKNPDGSFRIHTLAKGERLTVLALNYYGDKSFWPYIYEVNRDKIKNPSLVTVGMKLYLPDPAYFGIDANDPASVATAKKRTASITSH